MYAPTSTEPVHAWHAHWIWDAGEASPRNAWRCFRRSFTPATDPAGALLHITADTRYVLWVNGQQVGHGPARSFPAHQSFDTHEIGHLLREGAANTVAVLVLHYGISTFSYLRGRGGLFAQIALPDATIGTDAGWRVTAHAGQDPRAERLSCQLGFTEYVDARRWPAEWVEPWFDDGDWAAATVIGPAGTPPWTSLVPRDIPLLDEHVTMPSRVVQLAFDRPAQWSTAIDVRNQFAPGSEDHANPVPLAGFVVTTLRLERPGMIRLTFPWMREMGLLRGAGLDGAWHDRDSLAPLGAGASLTLDAELAAGAHWLVLEVAGAEHGHGLRLDIDADTPFTVASPINGGESPFLTIGSFPMVTSDVVFPTPHDFETDRYRAARTIASAADLAAFDELVRPVPLALTSPADLFGLASAPAERSFAPVPAEAQHVVMANESGFTIPVRPGRDTALVIDLGRECACYVAFELDAPAGVTVDALGFEYLAATRREDTVPLNNSFRYVTRGGWQRYESPTLRGLRYLQLTFRGLDDAGSPVRLIRVAPVESHYPVANVGDFRCSDSRLDAIWRMSRRTVLACMEDTYVDCPAYEQTFWVGDAYSSSRFAAYLFGAEPLTERCLRLVPQSATQTPLLDSQVPSGWVQVLPNWTFFWAMACREHWFRTGHEHVARGLWPEVRKALDAFAEHLNGDGLLEIAAWNLLDWAPMDQPNSGVVTHQNLLMVMALDAAAELAAVADDPAGAATMRQRADTLRAAINRALWDDGERAYRDAIHAGGTPSDVFSVQTQLFALLSDTAPGERQALIESYLLDPPAAWVQIGSPWMSIFLYDALAELGHTGAAIADARRNFGMMLDHGATTCWEVFPSSNVVEKSGRLTRSHCHAWSAAPAAFFPARLLGVRPLAPGWTRVLVAPEPCGLAWASGSVPLPEVGRVDVEWRVDDGTKTITGSVRAPAGVEIEVRLPAGYEGKLAFEPVG